MRFAPIALALTCACHASVQTASTDGGGDLPDGGHALPGPGRAAAWRIADPAELIAGPSTGGRVGDWELANSRIRVIVEDARASDGYDPYGCSIAAADRQRDAGVPGESRFGEIWMGLNFRAPGCDRMLLVNDGRDGEPAVIRAEGHDAESPFMASLFTVTAQPPALHASIFREYSLAPDTDALQLAITIRNDDASNELYLRQAYVGMAMNRGLRHWVDQSGFDFDFSDLARVNTSAEFYAAVGERVSYSVLNLDAPFSPILNFAHVLIGQYPEVRIPAGQAKNLRFALGVGTGDTGTLQVAHAEIRGASSQLVPLSGVVVDPQGNPVPMARVHVTNAAGDRSLAFARTAADGSWTSPMRAAAYGIRALADDRPGSAPQPLTVPAAGLTGLVLQLGARSRVDAVVKDAQGLPIPAKIVLEPNGAVRPTLPAPLGEMWDRQPIVVFSADGRASVPVFPSQWHVTFSRGFDYDRPALDVTAPAGGSVAASAVLHRVVDTTGWVSADFHVHAQFSADADDLLELKVRAFAGEGLAVPVSTEHEFIGDFGPTARALGLAAFMHAISGTEMTTTATGHFNIFPLTPIPGAPNMGALNWYNRTVPSVIAEARTRLTLDGQAPVVQMNHPRSTGMDYLGAVHFDPNSFTAGVDPADFMTDWDAMEVWNGVAIERFEGCAVGQLGCSQSFPTAFDWFSFLDRGKHVTGTGNSDSHTASLREVGYPRNYLQIGNSDPAAITDSQISAAVRGMKATISGGPFLRISVGSVGIGGMAQPDFSSGSAVVHLTVDVQAPAWMGTLSRLDIWKGDASAQGAHAQVFALNPPPPTGPLLHFTQVFDIPVTVDTWLLAVVRGPIDNSRQSFALWPVVQSTMPPFAITNPIWIDADANGVWTPLR
jgi:hypothetical protein